MCVSPEWMVVLRSLDSFLLFTEWSLTHREVSRKYCVPACPC